MDYQIHIHSESELEALEKLARTRKGLAKMKQLRYLYQAGVKLSREELNLLMARKGIRLLRHKVKARNPFRAEALL